MLARVKVQSDVGEATAANVHLHAGVERARRACSSQEQARPACSATAAAARKADFLDAVDAYPGRLRLWPRQPLRVPGVWGRALKGCPWARPP